MSSQTSRPLRVLCVEDDPDIQMVAKVALEAVGGLVVHLCSSGEEALQAAPVFGPDIVLLDVMMPGMDGPAVFKALRGQPELAGTPIAFMTAKVQPKEVRHLESLGACGVIAKPFDPMALADQVRAFHDNAKSGPGGRRA